MSTSFDTGSKKVTAFKFQYTVGRKQCPVCGQQKGFIYETARAGYRPWGYCFHCRASGPLRYLEQGSSKRMARHLGFQDLMCRANQCFIRTGGDTAVRGLLGIPFRRSDPIRRFYAGFLGYGPFRSIQVARDSLHCRLTGGNRRLWSDTGLILAIQDWPGRITGFLCLSSEQTCVLRIPGKSGVCMLRTCPSERRKHYATLEEACREGAMYGSLDLNINITCDPEL